MRADAEWEGLEMRLTGKDEYYKVIQRCSGLVPSPARICHVAFPS